MLNFRQIRKYMIALVAIYLISCMVFYFVGGEQLQRGYMQTDKMPMATDAVGEIVKGIVLEQPFQIDATYIDKVTVMGSNIERENKGILEFSICTQGGSVLGSGLLDMKQVPTDAPFGVEFKPSIMVPENEPFMLRVSSPDASDGSAVTVFYASTISLLQGTWPIALTDSQKLRINGSVVDGILCFEVSGAKQRWFGEYFWIFALIGFLAVAAYASYMLYCVKQERACKGLVPFQVLIKYRFLIDQLVSRDFKTKYKRSVLGILWSLLNPLLTMAVQYIVFSTLFRSDISNFPVYLITGIICFGFFNEVTGMSLTAIVGNSSLITKVYIPKYIYPLTRAMSSVINLLLSLIPLLLVLLFTRTRITSAVLLLPFPIVCLFLFCLGMGLILSAAMVFFRDTQFLWGILTMIWMYMTPIFYPETIIPDRFLIIYKLNPLYHIVRFFRIIFLEGLSPEPRAYLLCAIASIIPFILGIIIFKKTQDRFVLYI